MQVKNISSPDQQRDKFSKRLVLVVSECNPISLMVFSIHVVLYLGDATEHLGTVLPYILQASGHVLLSIPVVAGMPHGVNVSLNVHHSHAHLQNSLGSSHRIYLYRFFCSRNRTFFRTA